MYKIKVQDSTYETAKDGGKLALNEKIMDWDLVQITKDRYHAIHEHQSYLLEVEEVDFASKLFKIKVNGVSVAVSAQDEMDLLLDKLGMSQATTKVVKDVKAPMPGLILDILVQVGDQVKKDDKLVILEAMKMENVVKSPREGVISAIKAKKGENVEKNQVLILFE